MIVDLKVAFLSILIVFISLLVGCTRKEVSVSTPAIPKIFRWAMHEDCSNLDWTTSFSKSCLQLETLFMEGLTKSEEKEGRFRPLPRLAESLNFRTPTVLTIKIKPNVKWSNGVPLEASHFIKSWKKLLTSAQNSMNASLFFPVHGARPYFEHRLPFSAVGIKALDPTTIELTFDEPQPQFPLVLSHPATFPILNDTVLAPPANLGKFQIAERDLGRFVRLRVNPSYYGSLPSFTEIEITFADSILDNARSRLHFFQEGKVDFVDNLALGMKIDSSLQEFTEFAPSLTNFYLSFNTQKRPFQLAETRKSLTESIDRNEFGTLLRLTPKSPPTAPDWPVKMNVDAARKYWTPSQKTSNPKLTLGWTPGGLASEIAENLQAQWIKNLELRLELVPDTQNQDLQVYLSQQNAAIVEAHMNPLLKYRGLEQFMTKSSPFHLLPRTALFPEISRLLESLTHENYDSIFEQVSENMIGKEALILPLLNRPQVLLRRKNIQNLKQNALEIWDLDALEIGN